jgi:hypothetical protein
MSVRSVKFVNVRFGIQDSAEVRRVLMCSGNLLEIYPEFYRLLVCPWALGGKVNRRVVVAGVSMEPGESRPCKPFCQGKQTLTEAAGDKSRHRGSEATIPYP